MRNFFLAPMCGLLLVVAACGSDPSEPGDPGGGEIRSQADVQRFFEAIVPDLIEAFTELAGELGPPAFSSSADKGGSMSATIECPGPGGGTLSLDLVTFETTLSACSVGGVTISATLFLSVTDFGMSMYSATFSGPLMVSGSFTGTVMVDYALISWTAPATVDNTFWEVQGSVDDQPFFASSAGGSGGGSCDPVNPMNMMPLNTGERDDPCDDDSDCKSTCRLTPTDPSEACTCRPPDDGGGCPQCIGVDAGPPDGPSNVATACDAVGPFECSCLTESGLTEFFYLEGGGCFY